LTEAIQISLSGIRLGQIAQANGRSEAVRQFGERLAEAYAALNKAARFVAFLWGVKFPRKPKPEVTQDHERLSKVGIDAFDGDFLRTVIEAHKKDIKMFRLKARLREHEPLATEFLEIIQRQLAIARRLRQHAHGPAIRAQRAKLTQLRGYFQSLHYANRHPDVVA
jgi:putative membrane protein